MGYYAQLAQKAEEGEIFNEPLRSRNPRWWQWLYLWPLIPILFTMIVISAIKERWFRYGTK